MILVANDAKMLLGIPFAMNYVIIDQLDLSLTRHLQHVGTCKVHREMHQAAHINQRTANLTDFLRVARSELFW